MTEKDLPALAKTIGALMDKGQSYDDAIAAAVAAKRGRRPVRTREVDLLSFAKLAAVRVIWRQPDLMALWGIPYEMRADVGQSPRHIWEGEAKRAGYPGAVPEGWIWLGQPGWWGAMSRADRGLAEAFLASIPADWLPADPCEWCRLADFGR